MVPKLKEIIILLSEELKYHENIVSHCKGIESSLWGLEEQARFPENAAKDDQATLNAEINKCRSQLLNCQKLITAHQKKVEEILSSYKDAFARGAQPEAAAQKLAPRIDKPLPVLNSGAVATSGCASCP